MISYDQHIANQEFFNNRGAALVDMFESTFWPRDNEWMSWSLKCFQNWHETEVVPDDHIVIVAIYSPGDAERYTEETSFIVPKSILTIPDEDEFRKIARAMVDDIKYEKEKEKETA